ncbi:hypothetical protein E2320_000691 [Naja naja]|nr:hypothetical protein E2320_000691 [Naja naja]
MQQVRFPQTPERCDGLRCPARSPSLSLAEPLPPGGGSNSCPLKEPPLWLHPRRQASPPRIFFPLPGCPASTSHFGSEAPAASSPEASPLLLPSPTPHLAPARWADYKLHQPPHLRALSYGSFSIYDCNWFLLLSKSFADPPLIPRVIVLGRILFLEQKRFMLHHACYRAEVLPAFRSV